MGRRRATRTCFETDKGGTAMIEESYVSFETAKLLKEEGFDVPCTSQYTEGMVVWNVEYPYNFNQDDFGYSCPTQALEARWLRESHNIMIVPFFDDYMGKWYYVIDGVKKQSGIKCVQSASDYDDYETALEAGLHEAVKLIKK